jgi:hypothetical protein
MSATIPEPTRSYSLGTVFVYVGSTVINSGFAEDEAVSWKGTNPRIKWTEGCDGSATVSQTNSRLVEVELHLMQGMTANATLSAILAATQNVGGAVLVPFEVQDIQTNTLLSIPLATVVEAPERKYSADPNEIVWKITGQEDTQQHSDGASPPAALSLAITV